MFTELTAMSAGSGGSGGDTLKEVFCICRGYLYPGTGYGFNGNSISSTGVIAYNSYTPTIQTEYFDVVNGAIYAKKSGTYGYIYSGQIAPVTNEQQYAEGDLIYGAIAYSAHMIMVYAK